MNSSLSRRSFLAGAAAAPVSLAAPDTERYRLGVMAGMFSSVPLEDAMQRIRRAGYRYISIGQRHGKETVFAPEMPKDERDRMRRRLRELGVEPFLSLGGFGADPQTDAGLAKYIAMLDLTADFGIPVMVGGGPWYYTKFPNLPKRERDWSEEVTRFYAGLEKAVRHAETVRVTIALKPHTGITARARDCMQVLKRMQSPWLKIAWDGGNVSFYEGIYPDPDLPDIAADVRAVCIKDHLGPRGDANFPVPGQGQVDHELMFRTLFTAGFKGPLAIERVDGRDGGKVPPDVAEQRLKAAHDYLVPLLDRITTA